MKRKFFFLLMSAALVIGFAACSNDDVPVQEGDSNDIPAAYTLITKGVFVLNNGSSYQSIDGSLTYIDYTKDHNSNLDEYKQVNGRSLGGDPSDVIVYGEKVYIVGSDENTIFILHVRTRREINQVSTTALLGDAEGKTPRRIVAYDGQVYFTTHGGYVAAIDTINFALQQKYRVGSAPEGLAFGERETLYVANSDWCYGNGSISKIDITTGIATEIRNDKVMYPQGIAVIGDALYVLDWGYYSDDWCQLLDAGVYMIRGNDAQLVVPNATGMAVAGYMIYTFNDPLGVTGPTYSTYDICSNHLSTLNLNGDATHRLVSPSAISVDQNTGYIYIASRQLDPDTGSVSEGLPGFVNVYDNTGQFLKSFDTGVEPHKIEFYYDLQRYAY